ncbi:MAG: ImmA/IrrE family metallo-endopeptidase [Armatimonadetes bacterium]|nr:ImmA/IrrE family metallo-endopeptidase [Armatimonadota bacterium]
MPPLTRDHLAERIRQARDNARLTQDQLAELAGMERSALAKVEIAARNATGGEIERIAYALGKNPMDLLGNGPLCQGASVQFRSVTDEESAENRKAVMDCIALLQEARQLETYLGVDRPDVAKGYSFGRITNFSEAVHVGRSVAKFERARLGLGHAPIPDIADLINLQGIRAAAVPMKDEVSGIFLQDEELGTAILVNQNMSRVRRRFSYGHEYAHALLDRDEPSEPSGRKNAKELREARANAFAAEFLVPEDGIYGLLAQLEKGEASRFHGALFSPSYENLELFEERTDSNAQKITIREVALIAHTYRVSVDVATYRLFDIGVIRRPETDALLDQRDNAQELIKLLRFWDAESEEPNNQPLLQQQILMLAIEALRRDKLPTSRFRDVCVLTNFPADDLLDALGVVTEEA